MKTNQVNNRRAALSLLILIVMFTVLVPLAEVLASRSGLAAVAYLPLVKRPTPPPPAALALEPYASGFSPGTVTDIDHAGDDRLFVVEKDGLIKIILGDGTVLPTPFLDINNRVKTGNWEEGLLGVAFHPDYANNGYFYVQFTGLPGTRVYVTRYQVSDDPNVADPNSALDMLIIGKPSEVHNGGDLSFGPDGYLYIPIGDGGPDPLPPDNPNVIPGDPSNYGQRTDDLLGNILRIDVDQNSPIPPQCGNGGYTIPADNPFVGKAGCDEVWSIGFRNPWRLSFDHETGDMWIGEVGEWEFEEINYEPAGTPGGRNYGWHCYEGTFYYPSKWPQIAGDCPPQTEYTFPVDEYTHEQGCSVTGGYVYRGQEIPNLRGHYIFADFCWSRLWRLSPTPNGWERALMMVEAGNISTFGEDVNGELYVGAHFDDTIYKVVVP